MWWLHYLFFIKPAYSNYANFWLSEECNGAPDVYIGFVFPVSPPQLLKYKEYGYFYCEAQKQLRLLPGECCISSQYHDQTEFGSLVFAQSSTTQVLKGFEIFMPKSATSFRYCVLKSLFPTVSNDSVLNGYSEIAIKEGLKNL
jgi:hypothetical protein